VCGGRVAKRVTYDDRAAPHTPFFWCGTSAEGAGGLDILLAFGLPTFEEVPKCMPCLFVVFSVATERLCPGCHLDYAAPGLQV
jgi:hypothetical protein